MGRLATLLREFPFTAVAPRLDALAEALGVPERLPVEVGS
jgi:hypothetical protein